MDEFFSPCTLYPGTTHRLNQTVGENMFDTYNLPLCATRAKLQLWTMSGPESLNIVQS